MPNETKEPELSDAELDGVAGGSQPGPIQRPAIGDPGLRVGLGDPGIKVVPPPCTVELPPPCKD